MKHLRYAISSKPFYVIAVQNWWHSICTVQFVLWVIPLQYKWLPNCTVEVILCAIDAPKFTVLTKKYKYFLSLFIQEFTHFSDMAAKYKSYWRICILTWATVGWCFQECQADCCYVKKFRLLILKQLSHQYIKNRTTIYTLTLWPYIWNLVSRTTAINK